MKILNKLSLTVLFLTSIIASNLVSAEMVVIVHPSNGSEITKENVRKIYLGKTKSFLNNTKAIPIELSVGELRKEFLRIVLRKSEGQINSYWARMLFTGRTTPPKDFDTQEEIKLLVAKNPSTIGFIDSSLVDETVKVVNL